MTRHKGVQLEPYYGVLRRRRPRGLLPEHLPVAVHRADLHLDELGRRWRVDLVGLWCPRRSPSRPDRRPRLPLGLSELGDEVRAVLLERRPGARRRAPSPTPRITAGGTPTTRSPRTTTRVLRLYDPIGSGSAGWGPRPTTPAGTAATTGTSPATRPRSPGGERPSNQSGIPVLDNDNAGDNPSRSSTTATRPAATREGRSSASGATARTPSASRAAASGSTARHSAGGTRTTTSRPAEAGWSTSSAGHRPTGPDAPVPCPLEDAASGQGPTWVWLLRSGARSCMDPAGVWLLRSELPAGEGWAAGRRLRAHPSRPAGPSPPRWPRRPLPLRRGGAGDSAANRNDVTSLRS